ncbi:hypothetical protein GUJ93_ZPchr0013g35227 [Zizania palustris]|uniref:Transcription repressor n=1 Tax=Zizania palustris TaxID=103762 RepID=A0A8J6C0L1_ZIZPA|nr:hypothetical protein GUJ93_ZPchr0013g35227 [Zizania palustris]
MPLPSSWFHKLRRKRGTARGGGGGGGGGGGEADVDEASRKPGGWQPPMVTAAVGATMMPLRSPKRESYYFPSRERRIPLCPGADNPKLRDTRFPRSPQTNDIVFDVVAAVSAERCRADRFDGMKTMPELKLRPILTKRAAKDGGYDEALDSGTSAAASPTARVRRFHAKPSGRRRGSVAALPVDTTSRRRWRCRWLYESLMVVKESADPEEDFLESMTEMIAENDVRSPHDLEELLACYLALNAAEHHPAIVGAFRRAWLHPATATATATATT